VPPFATDTQALLRDLESWLLLALPFASLWILACARVSGLLLALPQFGIRGLPIEVKGTIVLALAFVLTIVSPWSDQGQFGAHLPGRMANELLLGLGIGFSVQIVFGAVRMAGQIIGIEMGLSFAAVADPLSQSESTPIASLMAALAVQLFLVLGLDRALIRALVQSVQTMPLGHAQLPDRAFVEFVHFGEPFFEQALALAFPAMGMLFATKLGLAFLARVAPRLHIFNLSFPLTLFIGMTVLVRSLDAIGLAVAENFEWAMDRVDAVSHAKPHVR
jgi:flagellar biosynthetic protein FliR